MNLLLGNPALLPALALLSVPILVHFFARTRPRVLPFSSVHFLQEIVRRTSRIKRPQSWLILFLRTLLFAALLAMLLKPILMNENPLAGTNTRKNVVLLVDSSASMAATDGARTRFGTATARAAEILEGLGSADLANIIWVRARNQPEFPTLGSNKNGLRTALQSASVTMEAPDFSGAFQLALGMLENADGERELHVISDYQETNWRDLSLPQPEGIRVLAIRAGEGDKPNQAITRLGLSQPRPLLHEETEVFCEVFNYSDAPVLRTVFLRAGESTQSQQVRIPPWSAGTASFACQFPVAGEHLVEVSIDEDDFPYDNTRRTVVEVRPNLRVLILSNGGGTGVRWKKALDALDWVEAEVSSDWNSTQPADVVFLDAWNGEGRETLQQRLHQGTALICLPGDGLAASEWLTLGGREESPPGNFRRETPRDPVALRIEQAEHPVFAIFSGGEFGDPAGGRIATRITTPPNLIPERSAWLAYADGSPALLEWSSSPRLLLWTIPLDTSPSWADRMQFLPLLGEILLSTREGNSQPLVSDFTTGQQIQRTIDRDVLDDEVQVVSADREIPVLRTAGNHFVSSESPPPGSYEWSVASNRLGYSTVNVPPAESDLRLLPVNSPVLAGTTELTSQASVSALREGTPLWPWLLALALLCAAVEGIVVWRTRPAV